MRISIFGLGYVGCVSGACFADMGHTVIGVDPNKLKVKMIKEGRSPIIEKDFQELLEKTVGSNRFTATKDWEAAIQNTGLAFICVGTPSRSNGSIDLKFVKNVSEHIGKSLKNKKEYYVVAVRSTVFPGTVEDIVIPNLEKHSGKKAGRDFGVCMVPEFLREGSSIQDFYNPPKTVIGEFDSRSGESIVELFKNIQAPLIRTEIKIAEMVKYADNAFHALKVTFANEIGNICKELSCDSHKVMDIFCMDDKLNLSSYYLKPGFAFGGSCLPKDLRAITYEAKRHDIDTPLLNSILESNKKQIKKVINKLNEYKGLSLGFLGLSFKGGTDDMRESPIVELVEAMIGKGYTLKIYDKYVSTAKLIGSNKEYIEKEIPHISSLMCSSVKELINSTDVVTVGHNSKEFKEALISEVNEKQVVIDLVRIVEEASLIKGEYYGICW